MSRRAADTEENINQHGTGMEKKEQGERRGYLDQDIQSITQNCVDYIFFSLTFFSLIKSGNKIQRQ